MPAAIGVERAKQAVPADRLGEAEKARHRAFLLDQDRRVDLPGGVVERDDEVEIAPQGRNPAMRRAVLEQQHSGQRPAHPFLAVGAAPLGFRYQPGRLQRQSCHRVTELVVMPLHQLLVEMLHREIAIALPVELLHPVKLALRRTVRRPLTDPSIAQAFDPVLLIANAQPPEMPPRHPQQLARLLSRQPLTLVLLKGLFKTPHKNLP